MAEGNEKEKLGGEIQTPLGDSDLSPKKVPEW